MKINLFFSKVKFIMVVLFSCLISLSSCKQKSGSGDQISGPLRVSSTNPRYFEDIRGNIIYLTGSHTWSNLVDIRISDPPEPFDFMKYLDWMKSYNHNFIRLWAWESLRWQSKSYNPDKIYTVYPHVWKRTGPGLALDGKPKFNLEEFDEEYFRRLKSRIESAYGRGIYVSVMLFEGWSMQFAIDGWKNHPFHPENNINGVHVDLDGDNNGLELYTMAIPEVIALEEKYVKKVIDAVNGFENVLYEISNENHPPSTQWQYHMIHFIHEYEKTKPFQHPVGMTFQYKGGSNDTLLASPAEWISPNPFTGGVDLRNNPPSATGKKVILYDTDHLWGLGGNGPWVWKTFCRGMNPLFMDPYDELFIGRNEPSYEAIRKNMGYSRMYAEKMDLSKAIPQNDLSSTAYCLADPGSEYFVYQPLPDSSFEVSLEKGKYKYEWFNPASGVISETGKIKTGTGKTSFTAPFTGDAVLYLKRL